MLTMMMKAAGELIFKSIRSIHDIDFAHMPQLIMCTSPFTVTSVSVLWIVGRRQLCLIYIVD